jgi:hypothetical protein
VTISAAPIRVEPAFDDARQVRDMFERHAPYRAIAAYAPDGVMDEPVLPWFRGNWALGGKPLVDGAETILHNKRFVDAAIAQFGTSRVFPEFVVANVNAPMSAGPRHVDIPSFHGATREDYPLPFLKVMGSSELFEAWRVVRAGAISWFYEGAGGTFDYWPQGLCGPMLSERPPFHNVALVADGDRMYHRIGTIGVPNAKLPQMSASAYIQPDRDGNWVIFENEEVCATYPSRAIRLSVVWKAEIRDKEMHADHLTLDRIMTIFAADLRRQNVDFQMPANPLADIAWILLLQRIYADPIGGN